MKSEGVSNGAEVPLKHQLKRQKALHLLNETCIVTIIET